MIKHFASITLITALLSACGGGGGDSKSSKSDSTPKNNTPASSVLSGIFVDSPVAGLRFETPTQSGLTNSDGEFNYLQGEIVNFYLGNTLIGNAEGANIITPFTLVGITPPTAQTTITTQLTRIEHNSYDRAINIATLLQTFDLDANPENGIDLGNADTLLQNMSINLLVKASLFESQGDLNQAKNIASITRSRQYGDAIQHLYQSLDLNVDSNLVANFVSNVNSANSEAISYEYDPQGRLSTQNTDRNNDGVVDSVKNYEYDTNNNVTHITDTASSTNEDLSYDNSNNLLSRQVNSTDNDRDLLESYTYEDGLLSRLDLDQQDDGDVESSTTFDYDNSGNLTNYAIDHNGDGTPDTNATYTYENDLVTSFSEDRDHDGTPDTTMTYSYDSRGNRISHTITSSIAGRPSSLSTFEFDSNNNMTRYERDDGQDDIIDYIESYSYDGNNNRTRNRRDNNADGTWDFLAVYIYDAYGNRIRMIEDSNADGIADKTWEGSYQTAVLENNWSVILEQL